MRLWLCSSGGQQRAVVGTWPRRGEWRELLAMTKPGIVPALLHLHRHTMLPLRGYSLDESWTASIGGPDGNRGRPQGESSERPGPGITGIGSARRNDSGPSTPRHHLVPLPSPASPRLPPGP
ncbi:hypothetical protein SAMD00023353_0601920 [Rosellinia necatrix]|uniref:Uncharacterized protein n=1 Tax=Rosellinia necatrix TaxID=77044 RepID=A0A1S8A5Q4_ROSNE|nr:hypothetical protein SAMD00023353_0601920 [Rosellinia necatrix]